jgi:magnesium-transporting ATPase (P-type)
LKKSYTGSKKNKAQVTIRILTGDMLETAKAVGLEIGLIDEENKDDEMVCLTGEDLMA